MAKKNNYVVGLAVAITLSAVFGFLWFSGIDNGSLQASLSTPLDDIEGTVSGQ